MVGPRSIPSSCIKFRGTQRSSRRSGVRVIIPLINGEISYKSWKREAQCRPTKNHEKAQPTAIKVIKTDSSNIRLSSVHRKAIHRINLGRSLTTTYLNDDSCTCLAFSIGDHTSSARVEHLRVQVNKINNPRPNVYELKPHALVTQKFDNPSHLNANASIKIGVLLALTSIVVVAVEDKGCIMDPGGMS